jgi:dTDP-4-dehydrorhamnose reductase
MSKPTVLVTGQNGQLGNELKVLSASYPQYNYVFTDVEELDITDEEKVTEFFNQYKPAICINAAAYTAVDKAETDKELALKINAYAVGNLAENCSKINTRFIHISTDYVFDGTASSPYKEDYPVNPVNFYGESKLKGEETALQKNPSTVIIRTSWVYSFFGNNFVKTMLRLMKERESINVINDQFGSPTYAADLAAAIMHIATRSADSGGIYHFSNEGMISWFDFAVAIKELAGLSCNAKPIDTAGYPTPAKRPAYSVMDKEKIKSTFDIKLKDWKESLQQCLQLLQR